MTVEEIKQQYSMRDILSRYGIQVNRSGFARCPFHSGDRNPSMKVYQKDYHCFACGANGDIFTFVQRMDGLTFKEVFLSLGGAYEKMDMDSRMKIYHAQKERERQDRLEARRKQHIKENLDAIGSLRDRLQELATFSDEYCECQKEMTRQLAIYDELQGENERGVMYYGTFEPTNKGEHPGGKDLYGDLRSGRRSIQNKAYHIPS